MKIPAVILLCLAVFQTGEGESCKGVRFDGKVHSEQSIRSNVYKPSSLAIDHKAHTLYFTYIQNSSNIEYKTAKYDLKNKIFENIDVDNGFSLAVDNKRHLAYIGANKGIYKYDNLSHKAQLIIPSVSAWKLFFKDALYYIEFPTQTVYKYFNGKSKPYEDLLDTKVYYFAISNDYIVYSNGEGVFGTIKGSDYTVVLKDVEKVDEIREIALDKKGRIFVLSSDGIYKFDRITQSLDKVADIQEAYGMTFDSENKLIYSKENELIRLVPNNDC